MIELFAKQLAKTTTYVLDQLLKTRLILSWNLLKFSICARSGNLFHLVLRWSLPEVFCKKGVLRNFVKFIGTLVPESLFKIKLQALGHRPQTQVLGLRPQPRPKASVWHTKASACNFVKKETLAQVFSCELCEISKDTFCYRTLPVSASGFSIIGLPTYFLVC